MCRDKRRTGRLDFVIKVVSVDEDERTFEMLLVPDPRRYEWQEKDGIRYLYDRFDDTFMSEEVLQRAVRDSAPLPFYYEPPEIEGAKEYVGSRTPFIEEMLAGHSKPATFEDKSEQFLRSLSEDKLGFIIMCVDIVASTRLSVRLEPDAYRRLIVTALYEMSEVVPKFHGHVLKYSGDGLIAYFPEPSWISKHDLAIDCALTIRRLVYEGLNPIFDAAGYPQVDVRIGLDSGDAYVVTIGSPETKQHKDIIGSVVSLAAKIQGLAEPGDICLGSVTERNLHVKWRQTCQELQLPGGWEYKDEDGTPYRVYCVKSR